MKLILASQSPRRRQILMAAGIDFEARPANVEEILEPHENAESYVLRLARSKAEAARRSPDENVLGADTTVVVGGRILEKPADDADARRMLQMLSGREHVVLTGICLLTPARTILDLSVTHVVFSAMTDAEIDAYVASGEPMDKAGAYGIQGLASKFVERIEGDYLNIVGLPVSLVYRHLRSL